MLRNEQKVEQVVYGREYTLRADITDHDGKKTFISLEKFNLGWIDFTGFPEIQSHSGKSFIC